MATTYTKTEVIKKTPKEEVEQLMNSLLPFAEKMLNKHGEFYPYGGYMSMDGTISQLGVYDESEHPASQTLIDLMTKAFKEGAQQRKYKATAMVIDVRVIPPGSSEKTDAVQVSLDHIDNYS